MLIIEQYGVKLVRVEEKDIELVREWRNRPDVAAYMEFRGHISEEDQKKWFISIDNKYNYYFIIEFEGNKVGLINVRNYDPSKGFGEGGIFISDQRYIDSFAAVFASLCLLNFMFVKLGICRISRIRILRSNERAIRYNTKLGYRLIPGQENVENQIYELSLEDYLLAGNKLNKAAGRISGDPILKYAGDVSDKNVDAINDLLR